MTRREAILLTSVAAQAQRLAPVEELVSTLEMEQMAQRKLAPELFQLIAGGDRRAFERITFRPRMMVNTLELDLTTELFGERHFAPILIGPLQGQNRFHPDGERAMLEGATKAKAAAVLPGGAWTQLAPGQPVPATAKVIVVNGPVAELRKATNLPIVAKGVMTPDAATEALRNGANGIVVSNYRDPATSGLAHPIEVLPAIAAAVNGKAPIFIDGSFRRGSDVLKALALGARAVFIGRPALWGLAAYGARGVQQVMEQLQTELARDMAMCGLRTCAEATPSYVRIHRR